ncbi:MAG: hypothetical protein Q9222_004229 [Ikaeria aurantiellina]
MASKNNSTDLETPGKVDEIASELPKTISDATELTEKIGQRYLWVDKLCIVQDDITQRQANIWNMDRVFGHSVLLILAAGGENAESGLSGVRPFTRNSQQSMLPIRPDLTLVSTQELWDLRQSTPYRLRAWTLQEEFFARRRLIFVNGQVFFNCREASWQEDLVLEDRAICDSRQANDYPAPNTHDEEVFTNYAQMIREYTSRHLTFEDDVLNAFAGISSYQALELGATMKYGMPNSAFDWAVLWEPQAGLRRRASDQMVLPSWSWAGWIGPVQMPRAMNTSSGELQRWLSCHTWIIWYQWSPNLVALVWDVNMERKHKARWTRGPIGYEINNALDPYGRKATRFLVDGKSHIDKSSTFLDELAILDDPVFLSSPRATSGHMLVFWTLSANFYLRFRHSHKWNDCRDGAFSILDRRANECGYVSLDRGCEGALDPLNQYELIALSDARSLDVSGQCDWKAVENDLAQAVTMTESFAIVDQGPPGEDAGSWDLFNVMLIEWRGHVAERLGIGKIVRKAMRYALDPGPAWKPVLLG